MRTSPIWMFSPVMIFVAVDDADDGAGEVVLAVGVEAGHLGGLAADEGAAVGAAGLGDAAERRSRRCRLSSFPVAR